MPETPAGRDEDYFERGETTGLWNEAVWSARRGPLSPATGGIPYRGMVGMVGKGEPPVFTAGFFAGFCPEKSFASPRSSKARW